MRVRDIPSGWLGVASAVVAILIGWGVMQSTQKSLTVDVEELKQEMRKEKEMSNIKELSRGFKGELEELVEVIREIEQKIEPECQNNEK